MKNSFFILLLCITAFAHAADSLLLRIEVQASFFTTDNLQNIYYVNEKNEVLKYEWQTKQIFSFSDKTLGKPSYIDASNPMKVLVFYIDYNTVVWLDNTMSSLQTIKLQQFDVNAGAVCKGQEEDVLWLFDKLSNRILKLDDHGNVLLKSEVFTDIFLNQLEPRQMIFDGQTLFVCCENDALLLFDSFASFAAIKILQSESYLQVADHKIIFLNAQRLVITEAPIYAMKTYDLPAAPVSQLRLQANKLFLMTDIAILAYTEQLY